MFNLNIRFYELLCEHTCAYYETLWIVFIFMGFGTFLEIMILMRSGDNNIKLK